MTTVHAQPDYQLKVTQSPPPGYPSERQLDQFSIRPFAPDYAARRQAFLEQCLRNPAPINTKAVYYELARLEAGALPHEGPIKAALDFIDARKDCSDFVLHSILRLLYQYGDHPALSPELLARARQTVLNFKYWPDEPGVDSLCTWTENHQILFASAATLAGQLFPEQVFPNSGQTGLEKIDLNRLRLLRWLDLRARTGFSEWLSHVYYDEDLTALLSLLDFCQDEAIRRKAEMVIDLLLLDMALNSYAGVFGSSHGRSYENTKKWASNEGTSDTMKLLFGMGKFSAFDNMSAPVFALSPNYRLPPILTAIAQDLERPEMINRQRMGIRVEQAAHWGLGYDNFEDGMVFLSLEAYAHPKTASLVMRMFDSFNWWQNAFFEPFQKYRALLTFFRRTHTLPLVARLFEKDLCRNTREQVNLYTYRTPDYLLSCAQDYRASYGGDQQHIWQASLGPDAVCFTTHPPKREGTSPNYWEGSGCLPRAAQIKNVVITIYNISSTPTLYVPNRLFFTHAWLPRDQFDQVWEQNGWIFARLDQGYLALRSQQPYHWQDQPGEDQNREVIADGLRNIWICELGRQAVDGPFEDFANRISQSQIAYGDLQVVYHSPSRGRLEFGWQGPLRQDGQIVTLSDYPRYDNPYLQAEFGTNWYDIRLAGQQMVLDFETGEREMTA